MLASQNEDLNRVFSANEVSEKILASVVLPPSLAAWASGLLQTPTDKLPERFFDAPKR